MLIHSVSNLTLYKSHTTSASRQTANLPCPKLSLQDPTEEKSSVYSEFLGDLFYHTLVNETAAMQNQTQLTDLSCFFSHKDGLNPPKSNIIQVGVINEPANNRDTILHVLDQLHTTFEVGSKVKHLLVVGDGTTYIHLANLKNEYSDDLQWMILYPRDWHLLKNFQPVLMKLYFEAGLKQLAEAMGF